MICLSRDELIEITSYRQRSAISKWLLKNGFASVWQRVMKKFVAAGNERFHEHDIRGKVATDIDDPLAAQKLLGHQSIKMTEDYIKQRKADEVMPHGRKQCT